MRYQQEIGAVEEVRYYHAGELFREDVEQRLGRKLGTDQEWLMQLLSGLTAEQREAVRLHAPRTILMPVEYAVRRGWDSADACRLFGPERPWPVQITRSEGVYDVRASDLTHDCPLEVYLRERVPVDSQTQARMDAGTFVHQFSLADPPFTDFMDWYYLGWQAVKRGSYCEQAAAAEVQVQGRTVRLAGHLDAVCAAGRKALVIDYKSSRAPPAAPHRRYQRQLYAYQLLLQAQGFEECAGLIVYQRSLLGPLALRDFEFERIREEAEEQLLHFAEWLPKFRADPESCRWYAREVHPTRRAGGKKVCASGVCMSAQAKLFLEG